MQQQARELGRFFDGQFYASDIYRNSRTTFKDGCIMGTGPLKFAVDWRDKKNPQICAERLLIDNVYVDPIDGKFGKPRMMHEVRTIGREVAKATWNKRGIEDATDWGTREGEETAYADPITIGEAWHLPSSDTAGDGRHCIITDTCTLLDEPWKIERYPMAFFKWLEPSTGMGWYGESLTSQLIGVQVEINKILMKISQHMHLASSFIAINRGSKIVKEHLVNTPFSLLEFTGDLPQFITVQSISQEYFLQLDRLYAKAFEIAGITQLFATGLKPKGLDSGKAQREYKDTESERFMDVSQAWEEYHYKDIPEILVDKAQEIDEVSSDYSVLAISDDDALERIKWRDVNLDRDKYILQLHPTSFLPKQPAFKFQTVKELLEMVPELQPYALSLLDYPDLKAKTKQITAPIDYIEKATDRMLYGKSDDLEDLFDPPDAFTMPHLQQAMTIAHGKIQLARIQKAPEERIELLMRYLTECEKLPEKIAQDQAQKAAAMAATQVPPEMAAAQAPGAPMMQGDINVSPEINVPQPMPIPGR